MVTRTKKKILKVIKDIGSGAIAANTQLNQTIHTITDVATTKRFILGIDVYSDAFAADESVKMGFCITRAGQDVPALDDIDAEETSWLWFWKGISIPNITPGGSKRVDVDMKIQRKVKAGDVITFAVEQTGAGGYQGSVLLFIDET